MKYLIISFAFCIACIFGILYFGNYKDYPKGDKIHLCTMMGDYESGMGIMANSQLLWKIKNVKVYFLDDDGNISDSVLKIANNWRLYSGIRFIRSGDKYSSDIRVSFRTKGWWSYIGTDCLNVGKDSVTLSLHNLYLYSPETIKSVVLHEFGHSLGLLHEHQHPYLKIKWNYHALYSYYLEVYNYDSTWVKNNMLMKDSTSGIYCQPDLKSIMIYNIPPFLTLDSLTINEPKDLSQLDKKYIKYIYSNIPCD